MKFSDIKKFPRSNYQITVHWSSMANYMNSIIEDYSADFDPDFQRGHVWTAEQQAKYCEYVLRGGASGKDIYCNCPGWDGCHVDEGTYVLVDGKQRISAVSAFLNNKIKVFGHTFEEFDGYLRQTDCYFTWHVASIETRAELLEWYLDFNSGGTDHAPEELDRVRSLLAEEESKIKE